MTEDIRYLPRANNLPTWVATGVAIVSMLGTFAYSLESISVAAEGIKTTQQSALRDSCLNYVNFVIEQQAAGQADYQIDRTTDLLAAYNGGTMVGACGSASEIRQARESNTPLTRLQDSSP